MGVTGQCRGQSVWWSVQVSVVVSTGQCGALFVLLLTSLADLALLPRCVADLPLLPRCKVSKHGA